MPSPCRHHQQRTGDESRNRHVRQAVWKRRIEYHRQPIGRHHHTVFNDVALRGLHPRIRCQNPKSRHKRAQGHHASGEKMQARADFVPTKQHHPQETCFQEKRRHHFVSEQWACDAARKLGKATPVGAKLKRHHQTRHHPHAKIHGKNLAPKQIQLLVDRVVGF